MCLLHKPVPIAPVSLSHLTGRSSMAPRPLYSVLPLGFTHWNISAKLTVSSIICYTYWCRLKVSLALFQYFMKYNFKPSFGLYRYFIWYTLQICHIYSKQKLYLVYVSNKHFFVLQNYISLKYKLHVVYVSKKNSL